MPAEIVIPEVGETGMDVTFLGWLKDEGEAVTVGDALFEVDTSKSTIEVEAFADGILVNLRVSAGDVVHPRQVVALLLAEGESLPEHEGEPELELTHESRASQAAELAPAVSAPPARGGAGESRVRAMPRAKALARERGIELALVTGTGPGGAITVSDVERHRSTPAGRPDDERAARVRRAVARMTSKSWRNLPHFHLTLEADVTEAFQRLRPTVAICRAITRALERHPECNLQWQDGTAVPRSGIDLGILVDTPQGLQLPAIRHADELGAEDLRGQILEAVDRARAGALRREDQGARSVSVSNLGMFAVDSFAGVIATPDVLLLSSGRSSTRPCWTGGEWQPRTLVTLTLSVDHRALDGADGGRLLTDLEELLAAPEALT